MSITEPHHTGGDRVELNPMQPHLYPRRVLLAVSGLSPQIVTETIYALASEAQHGPFVPTEVHLITTLEGAHKAALSLLSDDLGWFHRLCKDFHLPGIAFSRQHIHIICDQHARAMNDIRSPDDNRCAADFITAQVRHFTSDPQCALHVSIAGGRKTMGFFLGYALVSEPFENSIDFFYPTPYSRVLQTRDGRLADTSMAEVTLADIPFVSSNLQTSCSCLKIARANKNGVFKMISMKMSEGGRVVIPVEIRRALGLNEGDTVLWELHGGVAHITTRQAQLREAQAMVRRFVPAGVSLADEIIADRRAENAADEADSTGA